MKTEQQRINELLAKLDPKFEVNDSRKEHVYQGKKVHGILLKRSIDTQSDELVWTKTHQGKYIQLGLPEEHNINKLQVKQTPHLVTLMGMAHHSGQTSLSEDHLEEGTPSMVFRQKDCGLDFSAWQLLLHHVPSKPLLNPWFFLSFAKHVLESLYHFHLAKYVHCDFKRDNLCIALNGLPRDEGTSLAVTLDLRKIRLIDLQYTLADAGRELYAITPEPAAAKSMHKDYLFPVKRSAEKNDWDGGYISPNYVAAAMRYAGLSYRADGVLIRNSAGEDRNALQSLDWGVDFYSLGTWLEKWLELAPLTSSKATPQMMSFAKQLPSKLKSFDTPQSAPRNGYPHLQLIADINEFLVGYSVDEWVLKIPKNLPEYEGAKETQLPVQTTDMHDVFERAIDSADREIAVRTVKMALPTVLDTAVQVTQQEEDKKYVHDVLSTAEIATQHLRDVFDSKVDAVFTDAAKKEALRDYLAQKGLTHETDTELRESARNLNQIVAAEASQEDALKNDGILGAQQEEIELNLKQGNTQKQNSATTDLASLQAPSQLIEPVSSSYTLNGYQVYKNGTVVDPHTGLQWMRHSLGQIWEDDTWMHGTNIREAERYTYPQAVKAASRLNKKGGFAGYSDWRLPTIRELYSLIANKTFLVVERSIDLKDGLAPIQSYGVARSDLPANWRVWTMGVFFGTERSIAKYLSATRDHSRSGTPNYALDFSSGAISSLGVPRYIRLVRGGLAPVEKLSVSGKFLNVFATKSIKITAALLVLIPMLWLLWNGLSAAWRGDYTPAWYLSDKVKSSVRVEALEVVETQKSITSPAPVTTHASAAVPVIPPVATITATPQIIDGYEILDDPVLGKGSLARDPKTGLIWQRCSVGQRWDGGTCQGDAKYLTFYEAKKIEHSGWRLPEVSELRSLVVCSRGGKPNNTHVENSGISESTKCDEGFQSPTIRQATFPITGTVNPNTAWYLTASISENTNSTVWFVNFYDGYVFNGYGKGYSVHARLVRARQYK